MSWERINLASSEQFLETLENITTTVDTILNGPVGVFTLIDTGLDILSAISTYSNLLEALVTQLINSVQDGLIALLRSGGYVLLLKPGVGGGIYIQDLITKSFNENKTEWTPDFTNNYYSAVILTMGGSLNGVLNILTAVGNLFGVQTYGKPPKPTFKALATNKKVSLIYEAFYVGSTSSFNKVIQIQRRTDETAWEDLETSWNRIVYYDTDVENNTIYYYRIRLWLASISEEDNLEISGDWSDEVSATPFEIELEVLPQPILAINKWASVQGGSIRVLVDVVRNTNDFLDMLKESFTATKTEFQTMIEVLEVKIKQIRTLIAKIQNIINDFIELLTNLSQLDLWYYTITNNASSDVLQNELNAALVDPSGPYFLQGDALPIKGYNLNIGTTYITPNGTFAVAVQKSTTVIVLKNILNELIEQYPKEYEFKEATPQYVAAAVFLMSAPNISELQEAAGPFKLIFSDL